MIRVYIQFAWILITFDKNKEQKDAFSLTLYLSYLNDLRIVLNRLGNRTVYKGNWHTFGLRKSNENNTNIQ
jgi:hypothetical protein